MKVFIAGKFEKQKDLAKVAEQVKELGHTVVSRWLWCEPETDPDQWRVGATMDIEDMHDCDVFVYETFHPEIKGCLWEAGFMFGGNMVFQKLGDVEKEKLPQIHRVGPEVMIYDHKADWAHDSWEEFLTWLQRRPS